MCKLYKNISITLDNIYDLFYNFLNIERVSNKKKSCISYSYVIIKPNNSNT